ncbi:MAG TPA: hypothetical protein VND91_01930 [Candidatus Saccharimonadia bacterium]|nr:hypothetical protein [Candidatus Saccharimonadia bacterium]
MTLAGGSALDTGAALDIDSSGRLTLATRSLSVDLAPNTAHDANWVWLAQLDRFGGGLIDSRWLGGAGSSSNIFARDLVWDGSRIVVVGDVQNPATLPAFDPVAALDCGSSCGTSSTTGGFVCSFTSDPLEVESCTRVVATGGTGSGGVRYVGVAQPSPVSSRPGDADSAKQASADRKGIAGHSDGTHPATTNTTLTTQQQVQAFLDFLFGPRPTLPPIVQKRFDKLSVKPGQHVKVYISVANPRSNSADIIDFTMEDNLPGCLSYSGQNSSLGFNILRDASGRILIGLPVFTEISPGEHVFADFWVEAGSALGPCMNTTTPAIANTGTAPPASATLFIEPTCEAATTGVCTPSNMSNASCWSGGVRPTNGCDAEIAPCAGPGTCTFTNDQPLGQKINTLIVRDDAFSFVGDTAYLAGGIEVPAGGAASVATRIESVDDELEFVADGSLTVSNRVELDGASLYANGAGTTTFAGGIEGVGDLHVFEGITRITTTTPTFDGAVFVHGGSLFTTVPLIQPIFLRGDGKLEGDGPYGDIDMTDEATFSSSEFSSSIVGVATIDASGQVTIFVNANSPTDHDKIAASGLVRIEGGAIGVRPIGTVTDGATYEVITSTRGSRDVSTARRPTGRASARRFRARPMPSP